MNIKDNCEVLEEHIKKSKDSLTGFMYLTDFYMKFYLANVFKKTFYKQFLNVVEYVDILNNQLKERNLDIKIKEFVAPNNKDTNLTAWTQHYVLDIQRISTLNKYNQILRYLEELEDEVKKLKTII